MDWPIEADELWDEANEPTSGDSAQGYETEEADCDEEKAAG
jgi:hypothetical protein